MIWKSASNPPCSVNTISSIYRDYISLTSSIQQGKKCDDVDRVCKTQQATMASLSASPQLLHLHLLFTIRQQFTAKPLRNFLLFTP
ncbi:hypothetical protein L1887_28664 [Cichorium endivia]|nr:hypothetical protein L1887_28664 [Cichorium endivia]